MKPEEDLAHSHIHNLQKKKFKKEAIDIEIIQSSDNKKVKDKRKRKNDHKQKLNESVMFLGQMDDEKQKKILNN